MIRLFLCFFLAAKIVASCFVADDITGMWYNQEKDAKIKVFKSNGKYFGKIEWLKIPNDPDTGKPKLDKNNDDDAKKTRPILGLLIMTDLEYDSDDDDYDDGEIYDPKSGNTYSLTAKLKDKNTIDLTGYIGFSFIGRTSTWTRVTDETK
jgi:uncharacterized protein (DUF2147 family)